MSEKILTEEAIDNIINALDKAGFAIVLKEATDELLDVMHYNVVIECDPATKTASIINDKKLWSILVNAASIKAGGTVESAK